MMNEKEVIIAALGFAGTIVLAIKEVAIEMINSK